MIKEFNAEGIRDQAFVDFPHMYSDISFSSPLKRHQAKCSQPVQVREASTSSDVTCEGTLIGFQFLDVVPNFLMLFLIIVRTFEICRVSHVINNSK